MKKIFKDKTVIITGIGRSGTSLVGQVIGSMRPVFYLFEPAITKYLTSFPYSEIFTKILFEDYFLPLIHGRGNMNDLDLSYVGNYEPIADIRARQINLQRRSDAIEYIEKVKPFWVIKHTEFHYLYEFAHAHFPGVRYINVFRNGLNVVSSAIGRGWFTDQFCNEDIVEPTFGDYRVRVPQYINDPNDRILWQDWNPATRAAAIWRNLNEHGMKYRKRNVGKVYQFRYEDFCKMPEVVANNISKWLGLTMTALTAEHISKVSNPVEHNFDIKEIMEPERDKFIRLNKLLRYSV